MLKEYPCVPYEVFLRYAIVVHSNNEQVKDFLRKYDYPLIETEYIDMRRKEMLDAAPNLTVRRKIEGEFTFPKQRRSFKNLLTWLVDTKLIFPFVYFHPEYIKWGTGIEVKLLKEVFLLGQHPYLKRIHNCATFFGANSEFSRWFPIRCDNVAFEWYKYIFFNSTVMETEGDWTYYLNKLERSEGKLYDACRKNEVKYVIWILGGIPSITLEELQSNLQSIVYWKTWEKMRYDFMGIMQDDRESSEVPKWVKLGADTMKGGQAKALPPPPLGDSDTFSDFANADIPETADDPQANMQTYEGIVVEDKKKPSN